jgi:bla regulator protein blaR1
MAGIRNIGWGLALIAALCAGGMMAAQDASPPLPPIMGTGQSPASQANASEALPSFDVVSIKPHKDEGMMMRSGMRVTPDGFQTDGFPLQMFLLQSFGLSADRILNEPDWVKSARYDIQAKVAPEDAPKLKALSMQERFAMMLPVLEDRFGLKFHHEMKDVEVYTLVVAKGGPKLKESAVESGEDVPPPPLPPAGAAGPPGGGGAKGAPGGPRTMMRMSTQGMTIDARGSTMPSLAQLISQQLGATVVDKTGLTGKYDFTLSFTPDNFMINGRMMGPGGGGPAGDSGAQSQEPVGPSLFTAVQEQLGLKLVAEKENVDVVVIDQIEQPTAN